MSQTSVHITTTLLSASSLSMFSLTTKTANINIQNDPKFHFKKFWKTNDTMQKYSRVGFIWMVTP